MLAVLAGGCGRHRDAGRDVFPPGFDPELASILLSGDDSLLVQYGYRYGVSRLHHESILFSEAVPMDSEAAFDAAVERLDPYREKILECLAGSFHAPGHLASYHRWKALGYDGARRLGEVDVERRELANDPDIPPGERLARLNGLRRTMEALEPLSWEAMALDVDIARALDEAGDSLGELETYRRALAREEAGGAMGDLARRIGTVGYVLDKLGYPDSAGVYYERAREVAYRMRRAPEAVYALRLLTMRARAEGDLARAYELMMESQRVAREFRAEIEEWDALRPAIELNTRLGAWKIVEDLLLRAEQVARDYGDTRAPSVLATMQTGIQQTRGTLLMAIGRVDEGSRLFAEIREAVRNEPEREHYASFLTEWGRGLLDAGRGRQALPILAEGYAYTRGENLPSWRTRLTPLYAQALLESGDLKRAAGMLAEFRSRAQGGIFSFHDEWVRHDAAAVRLAGLQGDAKAAERAMREALARLEHMLEGLDGSESAYLFLDSCRGLRSALHERLAGNPVAGYGLELYWRSLYRRLGRSGGRMTGDGIVPARALPVDSTVEGFMTALATHLQHRLRERGAVHCLYLIGPSGVVRWTADGRTVRRDLLDVKSDALRKDVQDAIHRLSEPPEAGAPGPGPDLSGTLARLAGTLLPGRWAAAGGPRLILVSPDGYLGAFPFETLNVAAGGEGYRPLLDRADVAYLRYDVRPPAPVRVEEPGVVVADPVHSPDFEHRYATLGSLPEARREAEAVIARSPSSTLLRGGQATRRALLATWENARFLYIASHFVRDAEVPYLVFLPMAPEKEEGGDAGSSYLDLGEIRSADLTRCSLVVLSGCASGVPYSDVARSGPGLGDAFLDAGAGSVIETFWHVDDGESAGLMQRWTARWAGGTSPLRSLGEVRRAAFRRGAPPQVWAAYGIELAGL